jgi:polyhydroxyalkanoate synthase
VKGLLPNAPEVKLERAPGGHLGVLTGRGAVRSTWPFLDDFLASHDVPGKLRDGGPPRGRPARQVAAA